MGTHKKEHIKDNVLKTRSGLSRMMIEIMNTSGDIERDIEMYLQHHGAAFRAGLPGRCLS